MLLSDKIQSMKNIKPFRILTMGLFLILSACQFQPLHGNNSVLNGSTDLSAVEVSQVNTRVAQQLRNHLVFLMTGGFPSDQKTYEAKLRVTWINNQLAAISDPTVQDTTAGTVTVTAGYDLIDLSTGKTVATGSRVASASYDRTGQVFANERAVRDAENRAAKEAAEALRLAIASDLANR